MSGIWKKIVGFFDLNKDGKISATDAVVIETTVKDINQQINDQITDSVTQVKKRVKRVKEEIADVKESVAEVVDQAEDVVAAVKGKPRAGRKPKKK